MSAGCRIMGIYSIRSRIEAVWGIRQVYGFTYSNHSLYALTGSFYNPGPYSGYLAMIFPICLYEWLKRKEDKKTISYYIVLVRNAIDSLCVACRYEPLGMDSRIGLFRLYLWYAL